jgi:chromosome segregation ATPase
MKKYTDEELQEKFERIDRLEKAFSDAFTIVKTADTRLSTTEKSIKATQELADNLQKSAEAVKQNIQEIREHFKNSNNIYENLRAHLEQHKTLHLEHSEKYKKIEQLQVAVDDLISKITAIGKNQSQFAIAKEVEAVLEGHQREHTELFSQINLINTINKTNKIELEKINNKINFQVSQLSVLDKQQIELISQLDKSNSLINSIKKELRHEIDSFRSEIVKLLIDKIHENLPAVDLTKISITVKEMIEKEIANISADAHNAYLKYNNIDAQVKLLEKRFENLALSIKKIELASIT